MYFLIIFKVLWQHGKEIANKYGTYTFSNPNYDTRNVNKSSFTITSLVDLSIDIFLQENSKKMLET